MSIFIQVLLWIVGIIAALIVIGYLIAMHSISSTFKNMDFHLDDEPFF